MMSGAVESDRQIVRFADGSTIELRPLGVGDGRRVADFVSQLSRESEYRRFLSVGGRTRSKWIARLVDADQVDNLVHGAVVTDEFGSCLVAVAESIRDPGRAERAEFALAVADRWQNLGVGSMLTRHLAAAAWSTGVRYWEAVMAADNSRMARALNHAGPRVHGRVEDPLFETTHDISRS